MTRRPYGRRRSSTRPAVVDEAVSSLVGLLGLVTLLVVLTAGAFTAYTIQTSRNAQLAATGSTVTGQVVPATPATAPYGRLAVLVDGESRARPLAGGRGRKAGEQVEVIVDYTTGKAHLPAADPAGFWRTRTTGAGVVALLAGGWLLAAAATRSPHRYRDLVGGHWESIDLPEEAVGPQARTNAWTWTLGLPRTWQLDLSPGTGNVTPGQNDADQNSFDLDDAVPDADDEPTAAGTSSGTAALAGSWVLRCTGFDHPLNSGPTPQADAPMTVHLRNRVPVLATSEHGSWWITPVRRPGP